MYKLLAFISILGLGTLASACNCGGHADIAPSAQPAPAPLAPLKAIATIAQNDKQTSKTDAEATQDEVIHIKVLSTHETEATLKEIKDQPCRFLTSLCPDRCGHATRLAIFSITKYTQYQKEGEYGDPKQELFYLDLNKDAEGQTPDISATMKTLKIGDKVKLDWEHHYITKGGSSYPTRPVQKLEKITE